MLSRRLGGSGLEVSRLGLGTMTWGTVVDEYGAEDQLTTFLDAGGTLLDTAPIYGEGRTEELVGRLLSKHGVRDRLVLAGKAGLVHRDDQVVRDSSRRTLLAQLDRSLRDLGTDHLDLWQIHRFDTRTPLDEAVATLDEAVRSGRVRYAGISNFTGWQASLAHARFDARGTGVPLVSTQIEYSLLHREPENDAIAAADYLGMSVLAWSPLGRGVLTGKYRAGIPGDSRGADAHWEAFVHTYLTPEKSRIVEAVAKASDGLGVPLTHTALAWVRDRPAVGAVIVGARTVAQLQESLASEHLTLPAQIADALSDVS
ncbi:aldo/keto reductase [Aeromicrobium camelliae]|uniref:Aldo/keto reductase n=1 Tax=Aeromicrobium camelliae TaxID=1538144 RepID=A0A3N6X1Q0_9ACTN|nr:aldo/keto reductase [Aeromicrobium camelliae]RQN07658.1 aldo/keto reductase [Aeromicrobium camelliae]